MALYYTQNSGHGQLKMLVLQLRDKVCSQFWSLCFKDLGELPRKAVSLPVCGRTVLSIGQQPLETPGTHMGVPILVVTTNVLKRFFFFKEIKFLFS